MKLNQRIITTILYCTFSTFLSAQIQHLQTIEDGYLEAAQHVKVSPDDNFVYAAGDEGFAIYQRNISTGQLSEIMATDSISAEGLGITHSGKYLFMLRHHAIYTYERDLQTGLLTWNSVRADVSNGNYANIEVTSDDATIAVSDDHYDRVRFYDLDTTNGNLILTQAFYDWQNANFLEGASGISFSADDKYLAVAPRDESAITIFKRDNIGQYQVHQEIEDTTPNFNWYEPNDAIFTSNNKYLFVATNAVITTFELNDSSGFWDFKHNYATGGNSQNPFMNGIRSIRLSNDEQSLFAITYYGDELIHINIDSTGMLYVPTFITDDLIGVDGLDQAFNLELSNDGQNIYVAAHEDDALSVFSFDTTLLTMSYLELHKGSPNNADALYRADQVEISPDGKHVYTTSRYDQGIAVFERDSITGILTFIQQYKFWDYEIWTGTITENSLSITPDGEHLYLGRSGLYRFKRNTTTGKIINTGNYNYPRGKIKVAPNNQFIVDINEQTNLITIYQKLPGVNGNITFKSELDAFDDTIPSLSYAIDLIISNDSRFVYVTTAHSHPNFADQNTILIFEVNPQTFDIQHIQTIMSADVPTTDFDYLYRLAFSYNEKALYVSDLTGDKLYTFSRNTSTGELQFVQSFQNHQNNIQGMGEIRIINTSPTDGKVFLVSKDSIAIFQSYQANDSLTFLTSYSLLNIGANWGFSYSDLAFANNGQHFYMVNQSSNAILTFENQYYNDTIPLGNLSVSTIFINDNQLKLKAFPNPTTDQINLQLTLDKPQDLNISIINNNGQIIRNQQFRKQVGEQTFTFDLADVSKGIYYLRVNEEVVKVLKL